MKFRMVDRILSWEPHKSIRGLKRVSFEEYSVKARFGDEPCLPESLLVESLFQLGNWLIILSSGFTEMGLIVRFQEVRFDAPLRPGGRLIMELEALSYRNDGVLFDGRAFEGERLIAAGLGCLATRVPLADYFDPENLKVLFSETHRPTGE